MLECVVEPFGVLEGSAFVFAAQLVATGKYEAIHAEKEKHGKLACHSGPNTWDVSDEWQSAYILIIEALGLRAHLGKSFWRQTVVAKIPPMPPIAIVMAVVTARLECEVTLLAW